MPVAEKSIVTLPEVLPQGRLIFKPHHPLGDEAFFELSQKLEAHRIEREPDGSILIMSPASNRSSNRGGRIFAQLLQWSDERESGEAYESSSGYTMPDGAVRSPDVSWISAERLKDVPTDQLDRFAPVVPNFVVEVRSPSDSRTELEEKMLEYAKHGVELGWLVDPQNHSVSVFNQDGFVETLSDAPAKLDGGPTLPGFICSMKRVWDQPY